MIIDFDRIINRFENRAPKHPIVRKVTKHFFKGPSRRLYVITPYWNAKISDLAMRRLKKRILEAGHSCLIYQFPFGILSDNVHRTDEYFKAIQKEARDDIRDVRKKYRFSEIVVIGMSLGCVNAAMIANKNRNVDRVILVVPGDSLAESLWRGIGTVRLRKQIKKHGIDLDALEKDWKALAPMNNIEGLKGKEIEVHVSRADEIIPYRNGYHLVKDMQKRGLRPRVFRNKDLGHYLTVSKFILTEKF